jgi:acyl carrier protein
MPLTPSGKLDRAALPAPGLPAPGPEGRPGRAAGPAGRAASPRELLLGRLFTDVFGLPVGPDDDFFELGGDSLMAMRLVTGIESELEEDVTVADLLTHPTPAALARHLWPNESPAQGSTA